MKQDTVWELIKSDAARYVYLQQRERSGKKRWTDPIRALVLCQGLQASIVYRLGQRLYDKRTPRVVRGLLLTPYFFAQRFIEITTGIGISPKAQIGRGFYIGHFGGVIVGSVKLGDNVTISHGVTIGRGVARGNTSFPTVGDRVWMGPGAKVSGPIHIGKDAAIGANAVVIGDVPQWGFAVGIPAKIRSHRGSFDIVLYEGMEADEERQRSFYLMEETAQKVIDISSGHSVHS